MLLQLLILIGWSCPSIWYEVPHVSSGWVIW